MTPYASLQPEPAASGIDAYQEALVAAALQARRGFRAARLEAAFSGPYRHQGLDAPSQGQKVVLDKRL